LSISVYIFDQGGRSDRGPPGRICNTSTRDQAKRLQHIVLVGPTCHALDCKAVGRIRTAGRRNDGSGNAGIGQGRLYRRKAVAQVDVGSFPVYGYSSGKVLIRISEQGLHCGGSAGEALLSAPESV